MHSKPFTDDPLVNLNKLKDDFELNLKYSDLQELEVITDKIITLLNTYREDFPHSQELATTINNIEINYKEGDLNSFIKNINIVTDLMMTKYIPKVEVEQIRFTEKSPALKDEIKNWVKEEKIIQSEDKEQLTRIKRKISDIYAKVTE